MSYSSPNATLTLNATVPALSGTITANVAPFAVINGDGHGAEVVLTANSFRYANCGWWCNSSKFW